MTGTTTRLCTVLVALLTVTAVVAPATAGAGAYADASPDADSGAATLDGGTTLASTGTGSNVTLSGRIVLANGSGAVRDRVWISGDNVSEILVTDADGNWNLSVFPNATYDVGYFQGDPDGEFVTGVDDGSPDVMSVRAVTVGGTARDLGDVPLPDASVLNVTVVDESNDPVEDAQVSVGHRNATTGAGFGSANGNTDVDGVFEITPGDPGVEIRGQAEVDVNPPSGSSRFVDETVERTVNVSADGGITVELNETDNVTITGTIERADGSPAANDFVAVGGAGLGLDVGTDANGTFSVSVPPNETYSLGYYQGNFTADTKETSLDDGWTDVHSLRAVAVGTANRSLGTMTLPAGHNLTVTVVNESGVPVENALVDVFHFNTTSGGGFGTAPTETDAQGRFRHGSPRHVGMETNGTTEVQVEPPTGSGEYVDEVYTTSLNVTNDTHVEVELNETNLTITQERGLSTATSGNHTKLVAISPSGNLTLDDGTNYHFVFTNEDTGGSVTVALNGSVELGAGDGLGFLTYEPDGSIRTDPELWPFGIAPAQPMTLVNGSIPAATGLTNFSVTLVDATSGTAIDATATQPSVVGYAGTLSQNSTTGQIRLSMPRDVLPLNATSTLRFSEGGLDDGSEVFEAPVRYDPGTDEYFAVIDASNYSAGNYSWRSDFDWRGYDRILKFARPKESDDQNITIESSNVTVRGRIVRAGGAPAADDTVVVHPGGEFIEVATNATGWFNATVPANASFSLGYHQGNFSAGATITSEDDGSPDLYTTEHFSVGENDTSIGTVTLPPAHNLTVTVRNESGVPVADARVRLRHSSPNESTDSGFGTGDQPTDAAGRFVHSDADHPGMEMANDTIVEVRPPQGDRRFVNTTYRFEPSMDRPRHLNVTLNETENVTITGTLERADGSPAVDDTVDVSGDADRRVGTDENGTFNVSVPANGTYRLGYYQGNFSTNDLQTSLDDGSVDMYTIDQVDVGTTNVSLGTVSLPTGHNVTVTVRNESGAPVSDARVRLVHSNPNVSGVFYGSGRHPTDAEGRFVLRNVDHPGMEMANDTRVRVQPPENDSRFVDTVYEFTPNLTGPLHLNVTLNETDVAIEQNHGFTTSTALNTTKIVGIRASRNLTLDNGTNYRFRLTDVDSGQSVTLAANGSAELGANDPFGLRVHDADGSVENTPKLLLPLQGTNLEADVVNGSIPTSSGTTNFTVTLLDGTGAAMNSTGTHASVVGYTGVLTQNSTTGDVRLTLPRDVAPKTSNVTLVLSKGDLNDGSPRFEFEMSYVAGADEFATVVNASNFSAGDYSWETFFQWRGTGRILQVRSPNSANPNVTLETDNVTITGTVERADGSPAVDDSIDVFGSNGAHARVGTDANGNFTVSVPPNADYSIGYYQGNSSTDTLLTSLDDGSPDMYTVDEVAVGTANVSLGTVSLPTGYNVTVTVRNESGVRIEDARVRLVHENPNVSGVAFGSGHHPTDARGRFVLRNADHPGMEMANDTTVRVQPPENDSRFVNDVYERTPTLDGADHITVRLNETDNVTVSGRVILANGSGASVDRVILANGDVTTTVATDTNGSFDASVPANATYAVGYHQGEVPGQHVTSLDDGSPDLFSFGSVTVAGNDSALGNLTLPDAFNVNVTVVDESGDPVEDARVNFAHQSGPTGPTFGVGGDSYTTDASGVFVVQGASRPGVEMRNLTHFEVRPPAGNNRFENRSYEKTLNVTGPDSVTFELNETNATAPPTINVSGRAFEADGDFAVDDRLLVAIRSDAGDDAEVTRTDAGGNFTLSDVNASEPYHLVYHQGNFSEMSSPSFMPNDGSADMWAIGIINNSSDVDVGDVNVPAGHVVNVTVVNESGVPVENASVSFVHTNSATDAGAWFPTSTGADGMARPNEHSTGIELVGDVRVNVFRPDNASRFVNRTYRRELNVTGPKNLTFELREKHNVTGRLLENDSTAATEDFAIANNGSLGVFEVVPTGSDGNYSMTLAGEGRYGFAFAQRNESNGDTITERDGTVDLYTFEDRRVSGEVDLSTRTMPEGHLVNISVVDESGTPVENATVIVTSKGDSDTPRRVSLNARTNADGVVQFNENVTPGIELAGNVTLEVSPPDGDGRFFDQTLTRRLTVTGARTETFELQERITISGRVFEADGDAAVDDTLFAFVRSDVGNDAQLITTDETGTFTIPHINASEAYHVGYYQGNFSNLDNSTFMPNDGSPDMYAVDVVNATDDVDLGNVSLPAAHVVNVTVVNESDVPVANASVGILHNNSATGARTGLAASTGENGTLRPGNETGIELVGNVTVTIEPPSNATAKGFVNQSYERNLTVTNDTAFEVTLQEIGAFGVATRSATDVGESTATLRGNLTGLGGASSADVQFKYWVKGDEANTSKWTSFVNLTEPGAVTANVTGLAADTTYVFRVQARDSTGNWTAGSEVAFTTAAPFGVTTTGSSNVTDSAATLEGNLTGLGGAASADVQFKYWVQGDEANTSKWTSFRTLTAPGAVTANVTGLQADTTYVFRAQARDSSGNWTAGSTVTLTTAAPFGATTDAPTDVTATAATLRGNLTGLGDSSSADVQFKYWVQGDEANTSKWTSFQTLSSPGSVSTNVTGLQADTTYVFRVQARDDDGDWTAGSEVTFTTAAPFGVATSGTSNVTGSAATLEGNLTGLGDSSSADVQFKYWVQGDEANTSKWTSFQTLTAPGAVTANVTGLQADTTYVFRVQARDDDGDWTAGSDVTFTTAAPFAVETDPATGVNASGATLQGNLTGLGGASSVEVQFTYWVQGQQGSTQKWTAFETRSATGPFAANVTGLQANTTYVFRAQARNPDGDYVAGATRTFTTGAAFGVSTVGSSNVTNSSATFEGDLTGLGDSSSADVQFKYWVKGDEANTSKWTSFQTLSTTGPFTADVTGLQANTTYVFRAQARDEDGDWTAGTTVEVTTGN